MLRFISEARMEQSDPRRRRCRHGGEAFAGRPDQPQSWRAGIMRSILLWFLGVPIPIIILIALLYR
jgi:hypothetical protein